MKFACTNKGVDNKFKLLIDVFILNSLKLEFNTVLGADVQWSDHGVAAKMKFKTIPLEKSLSYIMFVLIHSYDHLPITVTMRVIPYFYRVVSRHNIPFHSFG